MEQTDRVTQSVKSWNSSLQLITRTHTMLNRCDELVRHGILILSSLGQSTLLISSTENHIVQLLPHQQWLQPQDLPHGTQWYGPVFKAKPNNMQKSAMNALERPDGSKLTRRPNITPKQQNWSNMSNINHSHRFNTQISPGHSNKKTQSLSSPVINRSSGLRLYYRVVPKSLIFDLCLSVDPFNVQSNTRASKDVNCCLHFKFKF